MTNTAGDLRARLRESVALDWHLTYNFFPPLHPAMHEVAPEAIAAVKAGEPDKVIRHPYTAAHFMDELRLWEFVDECAT
jgi:hypothetical protein